MVTSVFTLSEVSELTDNCFYWQFSVLWVGLNAEANVLRIFSFCLQMHHPIQMKPADSENRNGKRFALLYTLV
jgi:hypothetical protein